MVTVAKPDLIQAPELSHFSRRANYEIRIYAHTGALVRRIANINELRISIVYNDIGVMSVALSGHDAIWAVNNLKPKEHVNYLLSVYRDHPATGFPTLLKTYFIQSFNPWYDENGTFYYHLGGVSLEALLKYRLIIPEEDPRYDPNTVRRVVEAGITSDVIAGLVDNHLGTSALRYRRVDNLIIVYHEKVGEGGGEWDFDNLLDAIQELAQADAVDFNITYNPNKHEFEFHIGQVYRDRRKGNAKNLTPYILAERLGNLREPSLTTNHQEAQNALYIRQEPEDETQRRLIIRMVSETETLPYNRREFELNNTRRDESESNIKLITEGRSMLQDHKPVTELETGLQDYLLHRFLIDWEFGDKLTVEFANDTFDFQISGVDISVSESEETITPKLTSIDPIEEEAVALLSQIETAPAKLRLSGRVLRLSGRILVFQPR